MATRSGISERKLKPVWDAIDHRQYKTALKLATALLTKYPDSAYLFVSGVQSRSCGMRIAQRACSSQSARVLDGHIYVCMEDFICNIAELREVG
jgi:hypothetical protein